jgi:paraquat-inducible protein A
MHHPFSIEQSVACPDCDALIVAPALQPGEKLVCPRCSALLFSFEKNSIHRTAAFAVSAALLFVVSNLFPFMTLRAGFRESHMQLWQAVSGISDEGYPALAGAVAIFILAAPALVICGLLYLLLPLLGRSPAAGRNRALPLGPSREALEYGRSLPRWCDREPPETRQAGHAHARDLLLGVRRSHHLPDGGDRVHSSAGTLGAYRGSTRLNEFSPQSAAHAGLALCHSCGRVAPVREERCRRCDASLHLRNRESLQRTIALTLGGVNPLLPR